MICYVLAMGKQHLGPYVVVGYGIIFFWPGLFITSPDHLVINSRRLTHVNRDCNDMEALTPNNFLLGQANSNIPLDVVTVNHIGENTGSMPK